MADTKKWPKAARDAYYGRGAGAGGGRRKTRPSRDTIREAIAKQYQKSIDKASEALRATNAKLDEISSARNSNDRTSTKSKAKSKTLGGGTYTVTRRKNTKSSVAKLQREYNVLQSRSDRAFDRQRRLQASLAKYTN